jgi:serine phosphatase RsbU (regulator of sigma subunit)
MKGIDDGATPLGVDASFDRYARMVRRALDVPVALVSLVEADRQVFVGAEGLPAPYDVARQTPLTHSFCQWVVHDQAPVVTDDARLDERLRDNLAIPDLGVVAYAGHPIRDHTGTIIGSLCAIDDQPRRWTPDELDALADLAAACSTEIAQRGLRAEASRAARHASSLNRRSAVLLALSEGLATAATVTEVAAACERVAREQLGCLRAGIWLSEAAAHDLAAQLAIESEVPRLHYIPQSGDTWRSAQLNNMLRADLSNPLGHCLVSGTPLHFRDRADQNQHYPELDYRAQTGECRAFLPLSTSGRTFGAMAVIWEGARDLAEDELATLGVLATYAAQSLSRALLVQEQHDALVVLQTALLPRLPESDELEMAARYRPAATRDQVGGDWYDAVLMPTGATSLMIGDVVGHDIGAAATMGQMRTTLRALAWAVDDPPSQQVLRLEQAMTDLGVDGLATLVYLHIEEPDGTDGRTLRWTNAGHPPPLLLTPDGEVDWLEDEHGDVMLGVLTDAHRSDTHRTVPDGSTLLLYTDGLVERRGEDLTLGLERLRKAALAQETGSVADFLDGVLTDLDDGALGDDVAVLAVRFR